MPPAPRGLSRRRGRRQAWTRAWRRTETETLARRVDEAEYGSLFARGPSVTLSAALRRRLIAAAATLAAFPAAFAQGAIEPVRIGFLTVRTGALAAGGKQMEEGINLFMKERSSTIAGRKVELIIADTGGSPPQARAKVQELVEKDHVHVIIGPLATFEALAIDDYIKQSQVPLVTPTSAAQKDLAQQGQNDYVVHAVGTAA